MQTKILGGLAAVVLSGMSAVAAAETPTEWRVRPYLWGTGIDGKARLGNLPTVGARIGFGEVLENLNLGGMIAVEARRGKTFLLADVLYADLSERGDFGPGIPGRIGTRTTTALLAGGATLSQTGRAAVEGLAGLRHWSLRAAVQATVPGPGTVRARRTDSWIDPQIGVRGSTVLADRLRLTGTALVTPNADFAWDWATELGWRLGDRSTLVLGYRSLSFDRSRASHTVEATLRGPVLGLDLRF